MATELNITPKRMELLRFLADKSQYCVAALADVIAPRKYGWSGQGAARWGGGYIRPLESAGLVVVDRFVRSGVGDVRITNAGRAAIAAQDLSNDPSAQQLGAVIARCMTENP